MTVRPAADQSAARPALESPSRLAPFAPPLATPCDSCSQRTFPAGVSDRSSARPVFEIASLTYSFCHALAFFVWLSTPTATLLSLYSSLVFILFLIFFPIQSCNHLAAVAV